MIFIANYLPQFYPIPENDLRFGNGYTEWTAVQNAKALFSGHQQPRIPIEQTYYRQDSVETIRRQYEQARAYGINGFALYHYYFDENRTALERPAQIILQNPALSISYLFIWANETWGRRKKDADCFTNQWTSLYDTGKGPDTVFEQQYGGERQWKAHFQYLLPFFHDTRYIRIEGKPVFAIYKPDDIPNLDRMTAYFQTLAVQNDLLGIHIIGINTWEDHNLDAVLYQLPNAEYHYGVPNIEDVNDVTRKDYRTVCEKGCMIPPYMRGDSYFGMFVDFDNTPRYGTRHSLCLSHASPLTFEIYLRRMIKKNQQLDESRQMMFLNAWNEWGESNYLEPDKLHGYRYLQAVKRVHRAVSCRISVIIPVWNTAEYLEECLESVTTQTDCDFEIICVDDGSTDQSREILLSFQKRYKDLITVIMQSHQGVSSARNTGMQAALGEYLYYMDSDDVLKPCALSNMLKCADNYRDLDILFFSFENFCTEETLLQLHAARLEGKKRTRSFSTVMSGKAAFCDFFESQEYYVLVWAQLTKRSFLEANSIRFYEGIEYEDQLYTYMILNCAEKVFCTDDILYRKRIRSGSICTKPQTYSYIISYFTVYSEVKRIAEQEDGKYRDISFALLETYKERLQKKYVLCSENEKKLIQQNRELYEICTGIL